MTTAQGALVSSLLRVTQPIVASAEEAPPAAPDLRDLALAQQRFWRVQERWPGRATDTVGAVLRLRGPLDRDALVAALEALAIRHEGWRTTFHAVGGTPRRRVHARAALGLVEHDLSALSPAERQARRDALGAELARQPFDLERLPLVRLALVRCGPEEHDLVVACPHAVADGWSLLQLLPSELQALYPALRRGEPAALAPLTADYEAFLAWEREEHLGRRLEEMLAFWREHLRGAPAALELPLDHPRPAVFDPAGARAFRLLPADRVARLGELAKQAGASLGDVLHAVWAVQLHRYAGCEDLVVGAPLRNRVLPGTDQVFGCLLTAIPRRTDLSGDPGFLELVRRVRAGRKAVEPHRTLALQALLNGLPEADRDTSRHPVFQVMFDDLRLGSRRFPLGEGLELEVRRIDAGRALCDLQLSVADAPEGGLELCLEHAARLFRPESAERMLGHTANLIDAALEGPETAISRLALISPAERRQLVQEWNDTRAPSPALLLHRPFEAQAAARPDAVALACQDRTLTFGQLEAAANRLARHLQHLGVKRGDLVGICLGRSFRMVEAMLGVLKAGGAYVPLDPAYPEDRLAFMLEDTNAPVVLTERELAPRLPSGKARLLVLEDVAEELRGQPATPPPCPSEVDDVAYIIYTSGSTGRPKGVVVRHRPAVNLTDWVNGTFQVGPDDRLLFVTSMNFDLSVYDTFGALGAGASVRVATSDELREPEKLVAYLASGEITFWDSAPPALVQLRPFFPQRPAGKSRLRLVFNSGDWIPVPLPDQVRAAFPGARVISLGGATEATVWSNWYPIEEVDPAWPSIPYGKPIRNARYYVLDRHFSPLPVGIPGELFIAGPCLADGYLNRPELNAEKFLPDPFVPGERMYRTGDLSRWFPDGNLEFLGRIDHQVKVRGFRIELGEIEAVLNGSPGVEGSLVIAPKDPSGERTLVAYVLHPEAGWDAAAVKEHAKAKLPEYMVPPHLVRLDTFPLTSNGKVDRAALPPPERAREGDFVAPRGELEEQVAAMWAEVLHLPRVGRKDDFFALGGHSLLATRVIGRLRERLGVSVPVRAMFDAGTLERFARTVNEALHASQEEPLERTPDEPAGEAAASPLAPSQEVFWYQAQLDPSSTAYVIKAALRFQGPATAAHLRAAVDEMVRRHEALRTAFVTVQGEPVQRVIPAAPVDMTEQDASGAPDVEAASRNALKELAQVPFDLGSPPLLRGRLLRFAPDDHVLLLVVHHIVSDGWSLWLIIEELTRLVGAQVAGQPLASALPPLPTDYRAYARWYRRRMQGRRKDELLAWWGERLADAPPPLSIAEPRLLAAPPGRGSARILRQIPLDLSNAARKLGMREGATPFMVLLAAFQLVLQRWSGREDVVLGTPVAGRERPEHEPLIGCFVNTTVLRTRVDPARSFLDLLRAARETALGALAHADLPFPLLVRHLCPNRGREERNPLFEVFFNYLTPGRDHPEIPGVRTETLETQDVLHKFELTVYVHERPQGFLLDLVHDADRVSPERASALAAQIEHVLRQAVEDPKAPLAQVSLVAPAFRATVPDPASPLDPARGLAIHQAFLQKAQEHPQRVAVQDARGRRWTYGELQARAEGIARRLVEAGLQPEDVVAIHAARTPALVAALLGVLEAGGAWAILDPSYPGPRLARCLEAARPKAILLLDEAGPLDPAVQHAVQGVAIRHNVPADPPPARDGGPALPQPDPDRLAYVAFTSGSTGTPKAVAGDHRPVSHFLAWQATWFGLLDQDRFALLAGLSHDPLLRDVFAPLSLGGTVCVPTEEARRDPATLFGFLRDHKVSVVHVTPALAQLLSLAPGREDGPAWQLPALHLAFFGGDRLRGRDAARLRRVAPQVRCVNLYGTTETPQGMGFWEVDPELPEAAPAPIGRGIAEAQLLVLGSAGRCAPGELGEICVRSPYLTRGYLGDPAGSAERFVPGPARLGPWDRMYRTGDLGRYDPRGLVEFVGRGGDGQVQVRGYRVELGEVEAALLAQPGVTRALCRLDAGDERLVAWVAAPPSVKGHLLRQALRGVLPEPMVPASIEVLERFPLTPNGKIDLARLPRPGAVMEETARKRLEPRTQTEAEIARVWCELLGRQEVLVDDDFFQLGGHSLLAVRMLALLGERLGGVTLPVGLLMRAPRLGQLARALHDQAWVHEEPLVVPIQAGAPGRVPLWIIHPIGGHVVFAHRLAAHLDRQRPMFGIQARGLDGHQPPFRLVEEMAAYYVRLVREVQPTGPYLLSGPSFGGTVAFEMAQQLLAAGERIGLLALFDTFGPGYPDYKDLPGRVADHLRHAFRLTWRQRVDYVKERLQSRRQGRDLRWGKYDVAENPDTKGHLVDTVRGVVEANYAASTAYVERPYRGGKLHLFRAMNRPAFPGKTFTDQTNGWFRVVEAGVEVIPVDCIHQTIMDEPAVTHVGKELDRLLKRF